MIKFTVFFIFLSSLLLSIALAASPAIKINYYATDNCSGDAFASLLQLNKCYKPMVKGFLSFNVTLASEYYVSAWTSDHCKGDAPATKVFGPRDNCVITEDDDIVPQGFMLQKAWI